MAVGQELLHLSEAASRSGVGADRLRQWCATGLLDCERVERQWMISVDCLGEIGRLAAEGGRRRAADDARQIAVGAMFSSEPGAHDVLRRLTGKGIAIREANLAPMALDRVDGVLLAVTVEANDADEVVAIAEACGGTVIAELRADAEGD